MGKGQVLVTGSAGLVGRQVLRALAQAGISAVGYDLADGFDICDPGQMAAALKGCTGVIHLAAISRVAWGEADPDLCHRVNVHGTTVLCNAAAALPVAPWMVFASSREVYGDPVAFPVREDAAVAPVNHYGQSKAQGERIVRACGLRSAIVRLSNVYGAENDHADRAVPSLLWRAMRGEVLRISGRDGFSDFVHVEDTARGIVMAAERLAAGASAVPTVHLATGVATSLGALADMAIAVARSSSAVEVLPVRSFDVQGFCGDPGLADACLGWRAKVGLPEGMARLQALLAERGRSPDAVAMPRLPVRG